MTESRHEPSTKEQTTSTSVTSLVADLAAADVEVRRQVREHLVATGRAAVKPLVEALKDRREMVRWEAAKALGQIADPAAAPAMVDTLEDEDAGVSWLAAQGLIEMGRDGVAPLLRALSDRSDSGRLLEGAHHVLRVLARREWGTPLVPMLAALDGMVPRLEVQVAAQKALCAMEETR